MPADVFDGVLERLVELGSRLALAIVIATAVILLGRLVRPLVRRRLARRKRPSYTRVFLGL